MSIADEYLAYLGGPAASLPEPDQTRAAVLSDFNPLISALVLPDGFLPATRLIGDTIEQLYEAATWSYAAMSANAEAAASLPLPIQVRENGKWITKPDHDLNAFIEEPLGPGVRPAWNLNQLIEVMCLQLQIAGDTFAGIRALRRGTIPQLDPWHPEDVDIFDDGRRPVGYRVTPRPRGEFTVRSPGIVQTHDPRDVLHIMFGSPSSMLRGHAPFATARRVVETDRIAQERARANLTNKIAPSMIIKHSPGELKGFAGAQAASKDQREDLLAYLKTEYAEATKDGRPIVLGTATDIHPVPDTIQQIAYADVRGLTRSEILAIYKTPPPLLGILENSTLQNLRWSIKLWWSIALAPMLRNILWTINAQVLRRLGLRDVRIWFGVDESELGLEILRTRAEVAEILVRIGNSANDANQRVALGMPDRPELDAANMGVVVAGHAEDAPPAAAASETSEAPAQPEPEEAENA